MSEQDKEKIKEYIYHHCHGKGMLVYIPSKDLILKHPPTGMARIVKQAKSWGAILIKKYVREMLTERYGTWIAIKYRKNNNKVYLEDILIY